MSIRIDMSTGTVTDTGVAVNRDAFGYCNLYGAEAVALKILITDFTEWRELAKEYETDGKGDAEVRLRVTLPIMQAAFDIMSEYFPVVLHYPSGGADIFNTRYVPGAFLPRER